MSNYGYEEQEIPLNEETTYEEFCRFINSDRQPRQLQRLTEFKHKHPKQYEKYVAFRKLDNERRVNRFSDDPEERTLVNEYIEAIQYRFKK